MDAKLVAIGVVHSPLTDIDACPKQYSEGAPGAEIELFGEFLEAANSLTAGRDVLIFTWLHKSSRETLTVHPRGDVSQPRRGVFDTRSPDRPNPIGLHLARITAIHGNRITVDRMEVLDGTPVVDIKPAADESPKSEDWGRGITREVARDLAAACRAGWKRGLLSGFNGNVSVRLGESMIITRSGAAKGRLSPGDVTRMDLESGKALGPGKASSEAAMHLEIYKAQPKAKAIFHSHPQHLLAHEARQGSHEVGLKLFEAGAMFAQMTAVPAHEPGSMELARAVGEAARTHKAVFMSRHGLACWGETLMEAEALSEELDSLARISLLAGC